MKLKKTLLILILFVSSTIAILPAKAQSIADLLQQLALDYQKLSGLKSTLNQMYKGYEVLSQGYGAVKGVSKGNFTLHQAFLDGLMLASPAVRKYPRVSDIINDQASLVSEYHTAYASFKRDPHFNPDEAAYMRDVYNNLVKQSLSNLSTLSMILSDGQVRMSDAERIQAIDQVYTGGHDQLSFLRRFNDHTRNLAISRAHEANDRQTLRFLYGIN